MLCAGRVDHADNLLRQRARLAFFNGRLSAACMQLQTALRRIVCQRHRYFGATYVYAGVVRVVLHSADYAGGFDQVLETAAGTACLHRPPKPAGKALLIRA